VRYIIIDGDDITSREELYSAWRAHAELPDYFGNNLDALHDSLSGQELTVELRNMDKLREKLGEYTDAMIGMLNDTALESTKFVLING